MKRAETPAGAGLIDKMRTARYDDIMQEPQPRRQAMLAGTKKRLVIELDPQEHGAIKAQALRLGISMKEYVLRQLRDRRENPVSDDLTAALAAALNEVKAHKEGKMDAPPESARAFLGRL